MLITACCLLGGCSCGLPCEQAGDWSLTRITNAWLPGTASAALSILPTPDHPPPAPPQIVFNPDGQTFDIAVDKLREDQLAAAAEAAAAERRREQQRAAAAAMGPAGARPAGGSRAEQLDPDVAVWRAAYARQKVLFKCAAYSCSLCARAQARPTAGSAACYCLPCACAAC